jgi:hypothetical protein
MLTNDLIQKIKNNLFYRSRDIIGDYHDFSWDRYSNQLYIRDTEQNIRTWRLNSSQAVCVDIWGCVMLSQYKDTLINKIFRTNKKDWKIKFEYKDEQLLHEFRSTSIDVLLISDDLIILIENKFLESSEVYCYYFNKDDPECNGNYEVEPNGKYKKNYKQGKYGCAFNGLNIKCGITWEHTKYWDYIPCIYNVNPNQIYQPCPFFDQYQMMRNLCFGAAIEDRCRYGVINCLAYIDSEKCEISNKINNGNYINKLTNLMIDKSRLIFLPHSLIIAIAKSIVNQDINELNVWSDLGNWINEKITRAPSVAHG